MQTRFQQLVWLDDVPATVALFAATIQRQPWRVTERPIDLLVGDAVL